jgi:autotransporter passenger strand-loop-strand repeat protein
MSEQRAVEDQLPHNYSQDSFASKVKDGSLGFVGDVMKVSGEIHFKSMLRIDGKFSGQIISDGGTLIISSGGLVTDAEIKVGEAIVNGTVEGAITASKRLVLGRTSTVTGNIATTALIVEHGALFNGRSSRIQESSEKENGQK